VTPDQCQRVKSGGERKKNPKTKISTLYRWEEVEEGGKRVAVITAVEDLHGLKGRFGGGSERKRTLSQASEKMQKELKSSPWKRAKGQHEKGEGGKPSRTACNAPPRKLGRKKGKTYVGKAGQVKTEKRIRSAAGAYGSQKSHRCAMFRGGEMGGKRGGGKKIPSKVDDVRLSVGSQPYGMETGGVRANERSRLGTVSEKRMGGRLDQVRGIIDEP